MMLANRPMSRYHYAPPSCVCQFCVASKDDIGIHGFHRSKNFVSHHCYSTVNEDIKRPSERAILQKLLLPTGSQWEYTGQMDSGRMVLLL